MSHSLLLPLFAAAQSNAALITFLLYTAAVFVLAWFSNRLLQSKNFISEYFLGSRGLGVWAFALTFAATSSSGGSFTGFPAKIYTHGWILALWIASYMVVPICAMGLLGKRINQVARISGSITVPDVIRDRFHSAAFGLLATLLIVFFMSFNLVAQFKAGSKILQTLIGDVPTFQSATAWLSPWVENVSMLQGVDPGYLLCLVSFALAVVAYTTYGGFHAVVWTDVMQGIVMLAGVIIMLPLAIYLAGGLSSVTSQMARMIPPEPGLATLAVEPEATAERPYVISTGEWFTATREQETLRIQDKLERLRRERPQSAAKQIERLERERPAGYLERVERLQRLRFGDFQQRIDGARERLSRVEQGPSVLLFRVVKPAVIPAGETSAADVEVLEILTPGEIALQRLRLEQASHEEDSPRALAIGQQIREMRASGAVPKEIAPLDGPLSLKAFSTLPYRYGASRPGGYVSGPGPDPRKVDGFLPLSIAISFFFMWAISGAGQPSSMVRLMAFNNSKTLRRSIFTVAMYYTLIYFPLVVIFCCARVLLPGREGDADAIMPEMAVYLTGQIKMGWLAGLLVAAPFAAVMSTVDSFLLLISSALVRDVYQRNINPEVQEKTIKRLSYLFTLVVGTAATLGALNPPQFLQDIIVYTGSGLAACFLAPMVFALYWPRVNAIGASVGMLAGFFAHLSMYVAGWFVNGSFFNPYTLLGFNPVVIGLFVSFVAVYAGSKLSPPPPRELVRKYFYR